MSQRRLHISSTLSLPLDAVTQTFAILGIRGSGKTNTAVVMMEEMLTARQQCVALDPTNAWYGIRSSRDGKSDGFKVYVFGGPNGDLPLEGTHGAIMADFVVETGASVIFSLRHLSMNDQRRFAMEFGERLHHLKGRPENRTPLCLFLDEADEFVPQRIPKGYERMFGAYDRLVRRDRNCGLGVVLISQRPQVINKDTLSQIETLICHRLLHKLDRKSVKEAWVEGHDVKGKADEFFSGLAALAKGDTWVWSPEWLDIFQRVHIRQRETFDSSATPKAGEKVRVAHKLAPVDLDKLKDRLAGTIEKAKADDPKTLRLRVQQLEKELKTRPTGQSKVVERDRVVERSSTADRALIRNLRKGLEQCMKVIAQITAKGFEGTGVEPKDIQAALDKASAEIVRLAKARVEHRNREFESLRKQADSLMARLAKVMEGEELEVSVTATRHEPIVVHEVTRRPAGDVSSNGDDSVRLRPGALRMLAACAQWYPNGITEGQVASMAKVKRSGGSFSSYKSNLVVGGYIRVEGDRWYATDSGVSHTGLERVGPAPSTTEEMKALWWPKLRPGAQRMLQTLIDHGGDPLTAEQLASESNVSDSGGSFSSYLSNLVTAGLVIKPSRGMIAAHREALFM